MVRRDILREAVFFGTIPFEVALLRVDMTFFNWAVLASLFLFSSAVSRFFIPVFTEDLTALLDCCRFLFCRALFSVDLCLIMGAFSPYL